MSISLKTLVAIGALSPLSLFAATVYWAGNTGAWDTASSNWTSDPGLAGPFGTWTNANADIASFSGAAGTVTLTAPITAGGLIFSTDGYTITGGTLTLSAASTIDTGAGTETIGSIIAGAGTSLTKIGSGTLMLTAANTYSGATVINGGILDVSGGSIGVASASASTMSVGATGSGTLRIENGGSVKNTLATIGGASGTTGTVVVDGAGSS